MIQIRGGQLVILDSTLAANTTNGNGAPVAVDIRAFRRPILQTRRGLLLFLLKRTGTGNAGAVKDHQRI